MSSIATENVPDARGHFGPYGGRYVPETLMHPLQELEAEYAGAQQDPEFQRGRYNTSFIENLLGREQREAGEPEA